MAPAKHPKWRRLLSSVARKRKINMNKGSPDFRIEAVLLSTVKKRKPMTSDCEKRKCNDKFVFLYKVSQEGPVEDYSWGDINGDWNLKKEDHEDLINLDSFFDEVRSHQVVDR